MPAETHQQGASTDASAVAECLAVMLDLDDAETGSPAMAVTLAELGVVGEDLEWLWEAVCEDLAERSLPPELEAPSLDPAMTVAEAAEAMARAFGPRNDDYGGDDL